MIDFSVVHCVCRLSLIHVHRIDRLTYGAIIQSVRYQEAPFVILWNIPVNWGELLGQNFCTPVYRNKHYLKDRKFVPVSIH